MEEGYPHTVFPSWSLSNEEFRAHPHPNTDGTDAKAYRLSDNIPVSQGVPIIERLWSRC